MELYSSNEYYKLYQGNMLDMLEVIEPSSIDSIITDPPYGLTSITKRFGKEGSAECQYGKDGSFARLSKGFMGKEWDGSGIEYNIDAWRKCYEVLKPGGYLLAFGGSRTFHRIACAIEDAGFEIRDTIMWLYGSGFPKSMDISKQIDKRGGESTNWFGEYLKNTLKEKNMTYSDLAKHFLSKTGGITGCVHNWVEGKNMPTIEQFNKICEILDLPLKKMEEAEREVIGQKKSSLGGTVAAGERNECFIKEHKNKMVDITIPNTDLAKQWSGWGTALKPSFEPIIVARKPFKGSLVDNVIEYGVGGINIDECRVGNEELHNSYAGNKNSGFTSGDTRDEKGKGMFAGNKQGETIVNGRFPANTILTYDDTDFDKVCGGFPDTKGFYRPNCKDKSYNQSSNIKLGGGNVSSQYNDSGSASRYFMNCKYTGKDEEIWKQLLVNNTNYIQGNIEYDQKRYIYTPKASKEDREEGIKEYYKIIISKEDFKCEENMAQVQLLKKVIYDLEVENLNILEYGKNIMVIFPKECKSIILTRINKITELKTWNLLIHSLIKDYTVVVNCEKENGGNRVENVDNLKELKQIITSENQELVRGVSSVVYQMLLKIKKEENWQEANNSHCTVKPTELMQYLVRLVCPEGATILDPFNGSGSTGKAVMYENKERNKNYKYIGIELTEEYLPISKARIECLIDTKEEPKQDILIGQTSIFDFIGESND